MRSIPELLSRQPGHLQNLMQQSEQLQELTNKLRSLLPEHLAKHCQVATWENGKVIVHSSNAAAGTVLRYQLPKILPLLKLDPRYQNVQELICHNRPPVTHKKAEEIAKLEYSDYAATLLDSVANTITDDKMQKALHNLAKSVKSKGNSS